MNNKRQVVTGLVVNDRVNYPIEFYKKTRAMVDNLMANGVFYIENEVGSIEQLEGRLSFILNVEKYKYSQDFKHNKKDFKNFTSKEFLMQKFLFYKLFYANSRPLIITEGKTDILYLKAALMNLWEKYPDLISKSGDNFEFKIKFLNRTDMLQYFFHLSKDGADSMSNIYNMYLGRNGFDNIYEHIFDKSNRKPSNPVILLFDNENNIKHGKKSKKPLRKFCEHTKYTLNENKTRITKNLYLITHDLVKGKDECEMEDLFDDDLLNHTFAGKNFDRNKDVKNHNTIGKNEFSKYVYTNYEYINFYNFESIFSNIENIIKQYKELEKI